MNLAPLSKRSNFEGILSRSEGTVNRFSTQCIKICIVCGEFSLCVPSLLCYNNRDLRILHAVGPAWVDGGMERGEDMQTAELAILDWVQTHLRCGFLDAVLPVISRLSDHGEIWIVLAAVLLVTKKHRWAGVSVALALLLDLVVCNGLLKPLIGRIRPFQVNAAVELLIRAPLDASFPSGHTAASLTAVTALWRAGGAPKWLRWAALALAVVIALSRIYLYVHWPTDVLGGVALGAVLGWTGACLAGRLRRRLGAPEKR